MPTNKNPSGQTITQYNLQTGDASNNLNNVAPSATSGVPVVSQGSSAQPVFGTAVVAGGGTGVVSFSNTSALLATGTTSTGNVQNIASVATGQVLASAGTSTLPAFTATPSVTSITLSSGNALNSYLESTWTPVITFGGGTTGITYTTQIGIYTKIGRLVAAQFQILLSNKGSSTGTASITGFPFTSANISGNTSIVSLRADNITFPVGSTYIGAQMGANQSAATPQGYGTATGAQNLTDANFANNTLISGMLVYFSS